MRLTDGLYFIASKTNMSSEQDQSIEAAKDLFDFLQGVEEPLLVLFMSKYVFSMKQVKSYLTHIRDYIQKDSHVSIDWLKTSHLYDLNKLSQIKSIQLLQAMKLWESYIKFLQRGKPITKKTKMFIANYISKSKG